MSVKSEVKARHSIVDTMLTPHLAFASAPVPFYRPAAAQATTTSPSLAPPVTSAPAWVTVSRRSRKNKATTCAPPAPTPTASKALALKKPQSTTTPAVCPRQLIIMLDGSHIIQSQVELSDSLNKDLGISASAKKVIDAFHIWWHWKSWTFWTETCTSRRHHLAVWYLDEHIEKMDA
jgi:hypothetical protein